MEYDNDTLRRRTSRIETFCWIVVALLAPVTECITMLTAHWASCADAIVVGGLIFPLYLLYARFVGVLFLQPRSRFLAWLLSIGSFFVIQFYIFGLYAILRTFVCYPEQKVWTAFNTLTIIRVNWWVAINMGLAVGILFIGKSLDEKSQVEHFRKESGFFQLRYLRAQLNPHFLFNTLNSVYSLAMQKSDRAPEVVVKLADIMRYLIYECNEERIPLDKEIEFIRNYIEIEKIRYNADIRLTVEGQTAGITVEPYLFISFIENGFKHAMDHSYSEPFIYITLRVGNGQLVLNVINSTTADLELQAKRINGKGLAHSRSLLELLYPDNYDLDIIQTEKDETRTSALRLRNARERLEDLYPDSHTLDVILNKSSFTVSLVLKTVSPC
jgi:two-component system, LytTR family, sensor kinase